MNEDRNTHYEDKPVGLLEKHQPVDSQPLGRAGLPETEPDRHGASEQEYDIPGNCLQVVQVENLEHEEQHRRQQRPC